MSWHLHPTTRGTGGALGTSIAALGLAVLVLVGPAAVGPAWAAGQPPAQAASWAGTDGFQQIMAVLGLTPTPRPPDPLWKPRPSTTLVIVLGDLHQWPATLQDDVGWFVRQGGAALIASDMGDDDGILKPLGVELAAGPVEVASRSHALDSFPDCPLVRQFSPKDHPLFRGVGVLATNRPGYIEMPPSRRPADKAIAWLPSDSEIAVQTNGGRAEWEPIGSQPLVVAGRLERGRYVVLADHSVFINEMLLQGNNAVFAFNCLDWLREGRRRRTVVLLDGSDTPDGRLPIPIPPLPATLPPTPPPLPSAETLMAIVNRAVADADDTNLLNRTVARQSRRGLSLAAQHWLIVVLTLIMAAVAVRRVWRARTRPVPAQPPLLAGGGPAPLLAQREAAILEGEHFLEPARIVAREFFERAGLGPSLLRAGSPPPRVVVRAGLLVRWWRAWQIRALWRLARGERTRPIHRRRFRRLLARLSALETLRDIGSLRLIGND